MENKKFDMKSWIELKNMKDDKIQNIFNGIKRELEDCIDKMIGIQIDKDIPTPECRIVDYEVNRSAIFYNTLRKIENHYDTKILNFKTAYKDGYIFGYINIDGIDYQFKIILKTKENKMKNLKEIKDYGTYTISENNIPNNTPRQLGKTISTIINIKNSLIIEYKQRLLRLAIVSKHRRKRNYRIFRNTK